MQVYRSVFLIPDTRSPEWKQEVFVIADSLPQARAKVESECRRMGFLPRTIGPIQEFCGLDLKEMVSSGVYANLPIPDKLPLIVEELYKLLRELKRTTAYLELGVLIESIERGFL